jgi:hypothetical protein
MCCRHFPDSPTLVPFPSQFLICFLPCSHPPSAKLLYGYLLVWDDEKGFYIHSDRLRCCKTSNVLNNVIFLYIIPFGQTHTITSHDGFVQVNSC